MKNNKKKYHKHSKFQKRSPLEKKPKEKEILNQPMRGKIEAHPDGYAFFVPDADGEDLFIPSNRLFGAMHDDKVLAVKKRYRGRLEAHVVEIVERGITKIICRVEMRTKHMLGVPMHRRFSGLLKLDTPQRLGEDDVVLCEISSYPEDGRYGRAEVVERLGNIEDKGIENLIVMNKYGLEKTFPRMVEKDAANAAKELPAKLDIHTKDLRKLFTVTIDSESARDFDDAISVERQKGGYALYVHIADVSRYVEEGGALDAEAYKRGTSVYFPEFAIPMLPEVLSNGACSLRPHEDRYTLTVKINYDKKGKRTGSELCQSVISSDHRLTYTYVNEVLAGKKADAELERLITDAAELTELIKMRRKAAGAIDFDLPEAELVIEDGDITDIFPLERGESERIIENFMIDANEVVAEMLFDGEGQGVYRNHGEPDKEKLITWAKTARSFGISTGRIEDDITPLVVQRLFAKIPDRSYAYILKSQLVRSMQRAEYAPENIGHFGLASKFYTHFTSPIRRYPDLMVHRLLKHSLALESTDYKLDEIARSCSELERKAEDAEREVVLYKKLAYMRKNPDNFYSAFVVKAFSGGFNIFIEDLLVYGTVDAADIPKGRRHKRLVEGDELEVCWVATDIDKLQAYFRAV